MKVLFISDNFPPELNAPSTRTYEHARRWVERGHEVTVITTAPNFPEGVVFPGYDNDWYKVELKDGIRVVRVKSYIAPNDGVVRRTLDYFSFCVSAFVAGLLQRRPDIVITTSPQFFAATAGWLLTRLRHLPWVFELRDLWPESIVSVGALKRGALIKALEWLEMRMYHAADTIVSVTQAFCRNLESRGVPAQKMVVVRNGADLSRFQPTESSRELIEEFGLRGRFVVGYLGTVGMAHGLSRVVEAAKLLADQPEVVFLICGSGANLRSVQDKVAREQIPNVLFVPPQPRERMPAFWSIQDLALIPLRDAPLFTTVIPSKIFEGMAMGIPLLMSVPKGEASELVLEAGAGFWSPPEDPAMLADAIRWAMDHPQDRQRMREAGLAAAPRFSRIAQADAMLDVLEATARGNRPVQAIAPVPGKGNAQ